MVKKCRRNRRTRDPDVKVQRNVYAIYAFLRPTQIFHHRAAPKGGDVNETRDFFDEYFEAIEEELPPTITLYRPVGAKEMELIQASDNKRFPPRLPEQPIFYPVCNKTYAFQISKWNAKESSKCYVVQFEVDTEFLSKYDKKIVGSRIHEEYWIPAEDLDAFNNAIVGDIEIIIEV